MVATSSKELIMSSSCIKGKILDAAIDLFAAKGIHGVTFEGLAQQTGVTRGSLYRLFRTIEGLFDQALTVVLSRALDPANFLLMIFDDKKKQDFSALVAAAMRKWYFSISQSEARLLMQASFSDHQWEDSEGPIEKMIRLLAASIDRRERRNKASKFTSTILARSLVLGIFQLKISFPSSSSVKDEKDVVEGMLQFWSRAVSAEL
jgi:AcrR family transcriptional regulator